jgi:DNA-binding winged helix-turn-helix (wHTH) protein
VHDQQIRPFDIYMSYRAILETNLRTIGGVSLGCSTIYNTGWGWEVLERVRVNLADVEFFCEKTDTEPFWETSSTGVFSFLKRRHRRRHLAPPPCTGAEALAIIFDAKQSADGHMNTMQRNLDRLSRKDTGRKRVLGEVEVGEGPIDFDIWNASWAGDVKSVLRYLELAPDQKLSERLQRLDREWEAFRAENEPAVTPGISTAAQAQAQLRIFPTEERIILHGRETYLPEKQFRLLSCLAEAALTRSSVVPNRKIEDRIWGKNSKATRLVSDVARDLRKALKAGGYEGESAELIKNQHGHGYSLNLPASAIIIEPANAGSNPNRVMGSGEQASQS